MRIAIIDNDKCKPNKCNHECQLMCPVNAVGKKCVEIEDIKSPTDVASQKQVTQPITPGVKQRQVARINEGLCIGCGICVRHCPFDAIQIVNLPSEDRMQMLHTYGQNAFRIYKLPVPQMGKVYGLIGKNGVGKTTLVNILSGRLRPNGGVLGVDALIDKRNPLSKEVAGTELQKYFGNLSKMRVKIKPQNIKAVCKVLTDKYGKDVTCGELLRQHITMPDKNVDKVMRWRERVMDVLSFGDIRDTAVMQLSGGELQRFVTGMILMQEADVYIFDEFSNYLDVDQRLRVAELIQELKGNGSSRYIFLVEHDMSILDYTADIVSILYGVPAAYGIVSLPYATPESINMYFGGFIPAENMRFRNTAFGFRENLTVMCDTDDTVNPGAGLGFVYEANVIEKGEFKLEMAEGSIGGSTYLVLLMGANGTGKTTFLNFLNEKSGLSMSYKRQYNEDICDKDMTVMEYLYKHVSKAMVDAVFMSDVVRMLNIPDLYNRRMVELSGGELQRVGITVCLGTPADMYLLDEPSANLDIEYRVLATKVIKRFLIHNKKLGFIVEHDIMMSISMGMELMSRIIVFSRSDRMAHASSPRPFNEGINDFLKCMNITFRSDMKYKRPRINQPDSQKDREQRASDKYYN